MEGQVLNSLEALIKGETPLKLYEAKKMEIDNFKVVNNSLFLI